MQYVGRAIGSVSKTWNSLNPATLSGAIDVIVVEHENGDLYCSPFHVRFGKFSLLQPSQKRVEICVNGEKTNIPMKLGEGGEAFFVFETDSEDIPSSLLTSPILSASSSPPDTTPRTNSSPHSCQSRKDEVEYLDLEKSSEINKNQTSELSDPQYSAASVLSDPATTDECDHTTPDHLDNVVLDMTGYKAAEDPDSISRSDEIVRDIIGQEFGDKSSVYNLFMPDHNENLPALASLDEGFVSALMSRSRPTSPVLPSVESSPKSQYSSANSQVKPLQAPPSQIEPAITPVNYVKTLRLTSVQLKSLNLNSGKNDISFRVNNGRAICQSHIYLWKADIPIVISDIDGTITKSDALGHMLAIIGRDWTHIGVAKLFTDIVNNGYNILYLTARSVGQADATRSYLNGVAQGGFRLPSGPVILSPDRTMAALKREVIMKKPEIFKMACLRDIKGLYNYGDDIYGNGTECGSEGIIDELYTPFYAGFGNRITDALSYRSVGIVSSRIFTINSYGDVHMELLELAGVKSSYVYITDLVDHFFPPVASLAAKGSNNYTDVSFWREPLLDLTDLEDSDASLSSDETDISDHSEDVNEEEEEDSEDDDYTSSSSSLLRPFSLSTLPNRRQISTGEDTSSDEGCHLYNSEDSDFSDYIPGSDHSSNDRQNSESEPGNRNDGRRTSEDGEQFAEENKHHRAGYNVNSHMVHYDTLSPTLLSPPTRLGTPTLLGASVSMPMRSASPIMMRARSPGGSFNLLNSPPSRGLLSLVGSPLQGSTNSGLHMPHMPHMQHILSLESVGKSETVGREETPKET